jgi:hypothetical protein
MLYIHALHHLTPKTAEVESVYLIREIKGKTPYPLKESQMQEYFGDFSVSETDTQAMSHSLSLVEPTIQEVERLLQENDPIHESVALQRTLQMLKNVPAAMQKNISFTEAIMYWQQGTFITDLTTVFNSLPKLKTREEKISGNDKLNDIFGKILRNKDFAFNGYDLVNEGQVSEMNALIESLNKGFLFHYTLEEEMRKESFDNIKHRLPPAKVQEIDQIKKNIEEIKRGVERAYQCNMRMVNTALVMYAYVKWLNSGMP